MEVREFIDRHFRHFNARELRDAARSYGEFVGGGGEMLVSLAGAMSTGELGLSLAEMIRRDKVHFISCTGANLEEDLYNLVAHEHYELIPGYRTLSPEQETELFERGLNRVTDTCIPEEEAMRKLERPIWETMREAVAAGERLFPHEVFYRVIRSGALDQHHQIDPKHSWLLAAAGKDLPMVVPGWEDSTLGNFTAARISKGDLPPTIIRSGLEYMGAMIEWFRENSGDPGAGFFQIGGGIAGDFPICVVPTMHVDLGETDTPFWSWFCQISDSTTSYGSYSGAHPNEKITWGKLEADTPKFLIESDATIVAPLVFAYVLGW